MKVMDANDFVCQTPILDPALVQSKPVRVSLVILPFRNIKCFMWIGEVVMKTCSRVILRRIHSVRTKLHGLRYCPFLLESVFHPTCSAE